MLEEVELNIGEIWKPGDWVWEVLKTVTTSDDRLMKISFDSVNHCSAAAFKVVGDTNGAWNQLDSAMADKWANKQLEIFFTVYPSVDNTKDVGQFLRRCRDGGAKITLRESLGDV